MEEEEEDDGGEGEEEEEEEGLLKARGAHRRRFSFSYCAGEMAQLLLVEQQMRTQNENVFYSLSFFFILPRKPAFFLHFCIFAFLSFFIF